MARNCYARQNWTLVSINFLVMLILFAIDVALIRQTMPSMRIFGTTDVSGIILVGYSILIFGYWMLLVNITLEGGANRDWGFSQGVFFILTTLLFVIRSFWLLWKRLQTFKSTRSSAG